MFVNLGIMASSKGCLREPEELGSRVRGPSKEVFVCPKILIH